MKEEVTKAQERIISEDQYREAMMQYLLLVASPQSDPIRMTELKSLIDQYEARHKETDQNWN